MTAELVVRVAEPDDRDLLSGFKCSAGSAHEEETERHIQDDLIDWAFAPRAQIDEPRILLLSDAAEPATLVAVAAHERLTELALPTEPLEGTKAHVVAVSLDARGTRIAGRRPGDMAFAALAHDALTATSPRGRTVAAIVATTNAPSLALCDRHGMTHEIDRAPGYVWRIGLLQ